MMKDILMKMQKLKFVRISDETGNSIESKIDFGVHKHLSGFLDKTKLAKCLEIFIFADNEMRENSIGDICKRVHSTFSNRQYVMRLSRSRKNWLGVNVAEVLSTIEMFLRDC